MQGMEENRERQDDMELTRRQRRRRRERKRREQELRIRIIALIVLGCFLLLAMIRGIAWWKKAAAMGISKENFATWLKDAGSYPEMYRFLRQGAVERMWEFVSGMR